MTAMLEGKSRGCRPIGSRVREEGDEEREGGWEGGAGGRRFSPLISRFFVPDFRARRNERWT